MQIVPRLYEQFKPDTYKINWHLDTVEDDGLIYGTVTIDGQQLVPGTIRLHAKGLTIRQVLVNKEAVDDFTVDEEADELIIPHASTGVVEIAIGYSLTMTDSMHGVYPCYFEEGSVKKKLYATQFESHHAREAFPCIDEPEAKAVFDVGLFTKPGVVALSNMPVRFITDEITPGVLYTSFDPTPRMSSYLVAFVVGELQKKSAKTKSGVEVNVWATKAQSAESLDFGLDVATRSIEFFDDYFDVPYPLPKADHVALPDFGSGAMENWGLITYREVCLLVDKSTALSTKERIATVITHETSHQWFGNLVTMKWWDDLWLNESFATLMEYVCVDVLFPDWNIWTTFATQESLSALRRDYLPGVQAIKSKVNHPDEISTLFDPSIVYAKGARALAMLRAYVGEAAFKQALGSYFKQHAYGNTVGDDLWKSLSEVTGEDIGGFMKPWLEQSGMPVVNAARNNGTLTLTQKRFVIPAATGDATWPIPLNGLPESIPKLLTWAYQQIPFDNESLIVLNHQATTHAIISYDDQLRSLLEDALENGKLDEIDRLSLLHDMSLLARAGEQTAVGLLELVKRYAHETSEPVWDIISLAIADLRRLVEEDEAAETALKQLVRALALPTYERLGWAEAPGESDSDTKLRATVVGLLGYSEHEDIIARSLEAFRAVSSAQYLPGELRTTILALTVKHGSTEDIDRMLEEHRTTSSSDLQDDLTAGLTATKDKVLIGRLISTFTDKTIIRPQDLFHWFIYLIRNRHGREMTWTWMTENWDWIEETYSGDKSYDNFVRYSAAALGTHEWLQRYEAFFESKRSITALSRAIELGVADITVRADWYERDAQNLCETLKSEAAS